MTVGVMRWACIKIVLPLAGAVVFVGSIPGVDPKAEVDRLSEVRFPVSKKGASRRHWLPVHYYRQ